MWLGKSPTQFIVCLILALLGFLIGLAVPLLMSSKLVSNMQDSAALSR